MYALSFPTIITDALVLAFGIVGIVQFTGVRIVRRAYLRWGYPTRTFRLTGALELLAAILLAAPNTRSAGVALAAAVNFLAVVLLLKNRAYFLALPGLAVMTALPFALLSVR